IDELVARDAVADAGELRRPAPDHLAGEIEISPVAFFSLRDADDAREQPILDEREIPDAFDVEPIETAVTQLDATGVLALGLAGDQPNGAADAVLSEQRALRSAQHLQALEIDQLHVRAGQRAVIDVVDVDRDRRLERVREIVLDDAAQADRARRSVVTDVLSEERIRHRDANVLDVLEASLDEIVAGEGRDGDRGGLDVLLAEARGDDDLFDARPILIARSFLRRERRARQTTDRGGKRREAERVDVTEARRTTDRR